MITDGGLVDRTAVLCCWKHLVEVSALCSQAVTPEVVVAVDLHVLEHMHVHPCMSLFQTCLSLCMLVRFCPISLCQYRLSLVVEVCVVVESSGREPRRPGLDRQCSRFCSSLDTLLEKAV